MDSRKMFQNRINSRIGSNIFLQKSNEQAYNQSMSDFKSYLLNSTLDAFNNNARLSANQVYYSPNKTSPTFGFYEQSQGLPIIISKRTPSLKSILKVPRDFTKATDKNNNKTGKRVQFTSLLQEKPLPGLQQLGFEKSASEADLRTAGARPNSSSTVRL